MQRPRRLRKNPVVREMIAEIKLTKDMFLCPYFVVRGKKVVKNISAMPGINHFSIDALVKDVEENLKLGLNKIMLFGVGDEKSDDAKSAFNPYSLVPLAIKELKKQFGVDLYVVTDICVCSYTSHGHCGIIHNDYVQNDLTVELLVKMALNHSQAGADMLAPSDMMDGRVAAIRKKLDVSGFENVAIMSHATKFASFYYGPFREAADCTPNKGDRKGYQMDFRNPREAVTEALLDEIEGADVLMVKPGLAYLDILYRLKQKTNLPLAVYNVSGEYALVKAAAEKGWVNEQKVVMETMYAFARAGANIITTYHVKDIFKKGWM